VSAGPGRFCVAADGPGRRRAGSSRCPLACQSRGRCGRGVRAARVTLVRRAGGDTRAGGRGRGRLVAAQQPWRSGDDDWHTVPLAPPGLVAGRPAEVGGPAWPPAGAACRACRGASACPVGRRQRRRPPSCRWASGSSSRRRRRGRSCHCRPPPQGVQSVAALVGAGVPAGGGVPPLVGRPAVALHSSDCNPAQNPRPRSRVPRCDWRSCKPTSATAPRGPKRHKSPAQWCLSCVHAQTRFSCKKLRNNLADRPAWGRKRRFRPQQFVQRKCASSGLSTLHHSNHLGALSTAIAFPQSGRRLPALHKKMRRQHLTEGAELQKDHVAYAVGIDNLPTVSSPCSWPTTATHAVMRSILIDDWIMETLSRHGDWLRVALDSWRCSLYQLVGHSVKSKPPTLAASPAVLPQFFQKSTPLWRASRRGFRSFLQEKRVCA